MNSLDVLRDDIELDSPTLLEGFPGVGLVGKLATDHVVDELDMVHYANVHGDALPPVAVYLPDDPDLTTPVRIYASPDHDLLALWSDVPVSPAGALEFAEGVADWFADLDVTPLYLSGMGAPREDDRPNLYGVATGDGAARLAEAGIEQSSEAGLVSGPTGALLSHAVRTGSTALGLVVEADRQFPDPEAASVLLEAGIEPLTGVDVSVESLLEDTEKIKRAKRRLAEQIREAEGESSQARPLGMYQ
ncbi:MAG: proteasome assembly chaperone family protein [Haloplanus sp.]